MENKNITEETKAREHEITDAAAEAAGSGVGIQDVFKGIETSVVDTYKAVEDTVVGAYKAVEEGAVKAYTAVEDAFVGALFTKPGETVEDAKKRLSGKKED